MDRSRVASPGRDGAADEGPEYIVPLLVPPLRTGQRRRRIPFTMPKAAPKAAPNASAPRQSRSALTGPSTRPATSIRTPLGRSKLARAVTIVPTRAYYTRTSWATTVRATPWLKLASRANATPRPPSSTLTRSALARATPPMLTLTSSAWAYAIPPMRTSTVRALTLVRPPCVTVTKSASTLLAPPWWISTLSARTSSSMTGTTGDETTAAATMAGGSSAAFVRGARGGTSEVLALARVTFVGSGLLGSVIGPSSVVSRTRRRP